MDAKKALYSGQSASLAGASKAAQRPSIAPPPGSRDAFLIAELQARLGRRDGRDAPRVLELSVGDGTLSLALADALPAARLTLVDISGPHLAATVARLAERGATAEAIEADLDHDFAHLPEQAFDVVIAMDILEHVFDVFGFVAHCQRVLRRGGALFLRVPNLAYARHRVTLALGGLPVTASWFGARGDLGAWRSTYGWDGGHLHYFTLPTLRRLLEDAGFRIQRTTDAGARLPWLRELLPGLLCGNLFVIAERGAAGD